MTAEQDQVFKAALSLPARVRAELADELLVSIYASSDESWIEAWSEELDQRWSDYQSGKTPSRSWDDVKRRLDGIIEANGDART